MRKFEKITSIFLSALLAFSMTAVSFESVSAVVDENGCYTPGDNVEATYRYYFAMPNTWLNEYTDTAGVYWWSGTDACGAVDGTGGSVMWPGYKAQRDNKKYNNCEVYYIDCPTDVLQVVWNNYIDGGTDETKPVYLAAKQTTDARVEFYSVYDSDLYSEERFAEMEKSYNGDRSALGEYADNFFYDEEYDLGLSFCFDNMIYVIDSSKTTENFNGKKTSVGDWYFCYDNGEYGTYPTRDEAEAKEALYNLDEWQDVSSVPDEPLPTNPVPIDPTVPSPTDPVYPDDDEGQIHFDVKKSGWDLNTNKKFYCHIWKYDGSPTSSGTDWLQWQSKKELCSFDADTGIASFDLKITGHNFDVSDGAVYCVIFSSNTGNQTFTAVMDGKCIGDTLYCTDERFESPEDSEKSCYDVRWVNNPNLGSQKRITSTGNIVGYSHCEGESDRTMVVDFVLRYYEVPEILEFLSGIIDKLNLTKGLVYEDVKQITYDNVVSGKMDIYTREKVIAAVEKSLGISSEFYVPGDVNLDGQVTVTDATLIQKHLAGLNEFDRDKQLELADVNYDGAISILDATEIQFILAGRYTAVND